MLLFNFFLRLPFPIIVPVLWIFKVLYNPKQVHGPMISAIMEWQTELWNWFIKLFGGGCKVTHTSLYKHSYALTKHCWSRLKWPPKKLKKYTQKIWNSLLAPKIRNRTFSEWFYVLGDVLFCKFCQLDVRWKRVERYKDPLGSEAHVKNKETHQAAYAL